MSRQEDTFFTPLLPKKNKKLNKLKEMNFLREKTDSSDVNNKNAINILLDI